jgi:hypothetical protein
MSECVQCGYCCTKAPCVYGVWWGSGDGKCDFLTQDTKCAKYNEIREIEASSSHPMFGCGCSSSMFNTVRQAKIKAMQQGRKAEAKPCKSN